MNRNASINSVNKAKSQSLSSVLSKMSKNELLRRDVFGRTILHIIVICNRSDLLKHLLRNPEIKHIITAVDYESGWNCLHYIIFHRRLLCYKVLLDHLKGTTPSQSVMSNTTLFDMIRCKDRCRLTPLQLLDNDFKNLMWIPEYINEKDEFHLKYRYRSAYERIDTTDEKKVKEQNPPFRGSWWNPRRSGSDIYVLGANLNNNLGLGDSTDRSIPTRLPHTAFKDTDNILELPRFKAVKISKNHSLVLTRDGSVYSSGIGSRGRLGHGYKDMNNAFRFKKIVFFDELSSQEDKSKKAVREICASVDHSIALTYDNEIYAWGANTFSQLGVSSSSTLGQATKDFREAFEPIPRLVEGGDLRKKNGSHIRGIACSRIHSLAYTKHDVFLWGLNIGQMGFATDSTSSSIDHRVNSVLFKGNIQHIPKKITLRDEIIFIQACDTCTCVVTSSNDIHVYFQNQHIKLPKIPIKSSFDRKFDIFTPAALTKPAVVTKICMHSHEFICLLLDSGDVLSFGIDHNDFTAGRLSKGIKYTSVWKPHDRDLRATDISVSWDESIVLSTFNGLVFMKQSSNSKVRQTSFSESTLSLPLVKNKFKRIDFLNKVLQVACDGNFGSFAFIRDDIDSIPLKLESNNYIKDMLSLSPLSNSDPYRKQDQLLKIDHDVNSYVTNYLYSDAIGDEDEDAESEDEDEGPTINGVQQCLKQDVLYGNYCARYDPSVCHRIRKRNTYQQISEEDNHRMKEWLKQPEETLLAEIQADQLNNSKHFDSEIRLADHPSYKVKFHSAIFIARSGLMERLFHSDDQDEYFVKFDIKLRILDGNLIFDSTVDVKALLILIHFIYTNDLLDIWNEYPSGIYCPTDIKTTKESFEKLSESFGVADMFGTLTKPDSYFRQMRQLMDSNLGDMVIKLSDAEVKCFAFILASRSAFFETILASRWNSTENEVDLSALNHSQFAVILKHMYGVCDYEVFDELRESSWDTDEFITSLLEIIQYSDELLLFQLKSLCQLVIVDLITLDNVIILLSHSNDLSAEKLFLNCCWFIFNNLETILLDTSFTNLPSDILGNLENHFAIFSHYSDRDFSNEVGEFNQKYLKNWAVTKSMALVTSFLYNMEGFNENFMSDAKGFSSFIPLIDVRYEAKYTDGKKKDRKLSRKSSNGREQKSDLSAFRLTTAKIEKTSDEFAVDDDDSFELVDKARRRKSKDSNRKLSKSSSPPALGNTITPIKSQPQNNVLVNSSSATNTSSLKGPKLKNFDSLSTTPITGLSPQSNWASKAQGSSIKDSKIQLPVLGKSEPETGISWTRKPSKIKIGPTSKLSQKERKRLAALTLNTPSKESSPPAHHFAWGQTEGSYNRQPIEQVFYPSLGNSSRDRKDHDIEPSSSAMGFQTSESDIWVHEDASKLTLSDIMLEETLKLEQAQAKEKERKSLQEIQQEEEFAKWWEEESRRVQQQMQSYSIGLGKSKGRKKNNNRRSETHNSPA